MNIPTILCIMGPTASGKSDLAYRLAEKYPIEIISVDSAQVYRGMDIGTAKPSQEIQKTIPHHLIDIINIQDVYSAADFCRDATIAIQAVFSRGNIPVLVGGTMLYFKALQQGLSALPEADVAIRQKIEIEAKEQGWETLHEKLKSIDPESAARIHPNDPQRIGRALEVYYLTGKSRTELFNADGRCEFNVGSHANEKSPLAPLFQSGGQEASNKVLNLSTKEKFPYGGPSPLAGEGARQGGWGGIFHYHNIGLFPQDRARLHHQIEQRFHQMLSQGWIEETEDLLKQLSLNDKSNNTMSVDYPSMRMVGYKQIMDYLNHKTDKKTMIELGVIATRQLAKRQMTWLRQPRHWPNMELLDPRDEDVFAEVSLKALTASAYS